jgi:hypothetical protein
MGHTFMNTLSPPQLQTAIVETLPAFWLTYADRNPTAEHLQFEGAEWVSFGLQHPLFNLVLRSEQLTDDQVTAVCRAMDERKLPWMWCGQPTSHFSSLRHQLVKRGFESFTMPGMALDMSETLPERRIVPGLEIREATDMAGLEAFAAAILPAYDMPPSFSEFFTIAHKTSGFFPDFPVRIFYGIHEGRPVSGSMVFYDKEVAAIQCVGTLSEARSKGFASAVVIECLHAAHHEGYRYAVLHASEMGFPIYARLGFATCFHQECFLRS